METEASGMPVQPRDPSTVSASSEPPGTPSDLAATRPPPFTRDMAILSLQVGETRALYEAELGRLDATKKRVTQTFFFFGMLMTIVGSFVAWMYIQQYRFRKQFGMLIDVIDRARATGVYTGPSGIETIWAYEYGQIGAFFSGFTSTDLAVAITDSFYDANMHRAFLGTDNGISTLVTMRELSMRGDYSANQIMCATLFPDNNDPGTPSKCKPNCNASHVTSSAGTTAAYLGGAVAGLGSGAGLGMLFSGLASGPLGLGLGIAAGVGMFAVSMTSVSLTQRDNASKCKASLQGCINVANVTC